jgi:hypothetical protein
MSSFGANSVDASERLAARRSMERRLLGFHNGAAPAHTLRGLSLKGKDTQKITVEHVHVHSGGQGVVGVVEAPGEALA